MQPEQMEAQWGQNEAEEQDRGAQAHPAHSVHAKLIRMANQIATFFDSQKPENRAEGVATHINKFWEPRMRKALFACLDDGGEGLHPLVRDAAPLIRRPHADPDTGAGTGMDATQGAPEGKGTAMGENKGDTNFPEHRS
jgi:formate dehydrogenase subunit delta